MNDKIYDYLKFTAQIILPALSALYIALAKLWNLPFVTEIPGTIMAIDTFMGAVLVKASADYVKED